jgi:formate hydrogenlyase subunit 6/NADH:ubiquinone oxidoreductase subunit I
MSMPDRVTSVFGRAGLDALIDRLRADGYGVVGPTVRDGAIVYDEIASAADLPEGMTDEQGPGHYRLARREDRALFGFSVGPHSWKKHLFPASRRLFTAHRSESSAIEFEAETARPSRLAFLGVRACEIAAIAIQDRVFQGGEAKDADYAARREASFIVAVQCGDAAATCFCASMGTGPRADAGFDMALTEIVDGEAGRHEFVAEAGTERGARFLRDLPGARAAGPEDAAAALRRTEAARGKMGRTLDTEGIRDLLQRNAEHPRWDDVAARCLSCANCTMVCPTCFCSTVDDVTDLTGDHAERWQRWDSCFSLDFSHVHGGAVRTSTRARYRHWMTHKLATWFDQFGSSGCVGCGRCITWCPVGIDLTEEARAIRASDGRKREAE